MSNDQLGMNLPNTQSIDTVEGYKFEPIKGYPMLNWKGKRPYNSTQFYPAQLKEVHGTEVDGWRNKIYWGDNLQVMSHLLKEFRGKVNLVYIDPPFDSKADYKKVVKLRGSNISNDKSAFEEKQYTDIWNNDEYLQFMYERLILVRELLSEQGSIYVHSDYRVSSYLKIICDELFGKNHFRAWISWKSSPGHSDDSYYGLMQNHILFYTKSDNPIWNQLYEPYDNEYLSQHYQKVDEDGSRFEDEDLTAYGLSGGGYQYEWNGHNKLWRCPIERMKENHEKGNLYYTRNGLARLKRYLDKMPGNPISDMWTNIARLNSRALEKVNYPTQKPEALIERIIKASSNPSDIVFDCFMGSGTTQAVAMKLGRRFIGADINLGAVQITTKRLLSVAAGLEEQQQQGQLEVEVEERKTSTHYTGFESYNVNHYDVFRNPLQAKDLLLEALEVNRLGQGNLFDGEKDGRMVKIMPVNCIATRADLNELITGLDYKTFERRQAEHPTKPVEKITLVCMGHEPDLAAQLKTEVHPFHIDVEVVDILRDKSNLEFKRDSEARINIEGEYLVINKFYPMNLLQKLSLQQENVEDWRELVESIMVDWNYDGAILEPKLLDIPDKNELVGGKYKIPEDAGTIRIKITDLLSESLEVEVQHG